MVGIQPETGYSVSFAYKLSYSRELHNMKSSVDSLGDQAYDLICADESALFFWQEKDCIPVYACSKYRSDNLLYT